MSENQGTTSNECPLESSVLNHEEQRKANRIATCERYRKSHREQIKAAREANRETESARAKAWYEANKEHVLAYRKAYYKRNKEVMAARNKARYDANKDAECASARAWHHANKGRKYGITPSEYSEMLAACNGRCPCRKTLFSKILGTQPCIDHSHKLGHVREAVRGIVCHRCNFVLGHASDDPKSLHACARYLERFVN